MDKEELKATLKEAIAESTSSLDERLRAVESAIAVKEDEVPAEAAPAEEAPVEETPAEEPATETPAEEVPAEEPAAEEDEVEKSAADSELEELRAFKSEVEGRIQQAEARIARLATSSKSLPVGDEVSDTPAPSAVKSTRDGFGRRIK